MEGKTEEVYKMVLLHVKIFIGIGNVIIYKSDFEKSLLNAISYINDSQNKNANIQGCYFHYCQSFRRKIKNEFKGEAYSKDINILQLMFFCFHFISTEDCNLAIIYLSDVGKFKKIVKYYKTFWSNEGARFPPSIWSVCSKPVKHKMSTNSLERSHEEQGKLANTVFSTFLQKLKGLDEIYNKMDAH